MRTQTLVDREREGAAELILACHGPWQVRGVVRDEHGDAVPAAEVESVCADRHAQDALRAGPDGTFAAPLIAGLRYELRAKVGGRWTPKVEVRPGMTAEPIVLRPKVAPPASIVGTVWTAAGEPAVDATVHVVSRGTFEHRVVFTVHGKFRLPLQRFDTYELLAGATGSGPSSTVRVECHEGEPHVRTTLRLTQLGVIRGRVVDADGRPCVGVDVLAVPEDLTYPAGMLGRKAGDLSDSTDGDGAFEVRVGVGSRWKLRAFSGRPGSLLRGEVADLRAGATDVELMLHADPAGSGPVPTRPFQLRLTKVGGGDPGRCRLEFFRYSRGGSQRPAGVAPASTDVAKEFLVTAHSLATQLVDFRAGVPVALEPPPQRGDFLVRIHPMDRALAIVERGPIEAGSSPVELSVELSTWAQLPVVVFDASGRPLPAASVSARSASALGGAGVRFTDRAGRAVLFGAPPGRLQLRVAHPGGAPVTMDVDAVPGRNALWTVRLQ